MESMVQNCIFHLLLYIDYLYEPQKNVITLCFYYIDKRRYRRFILHSHSNSKLIIMMSC